MGLFLLLGFAVPESGYGQNTANGQGQSKALNNQRTKIVRVLSDSVRLDTLSLIPGSLVIVSQTWRGDPQTGNRILDSSYYHVDCANALVVLNRKLLKKKGIPSDTLKFLYRFFPFSLTQVLVHKDIKRLSADDRGMLNPFQYTVAKPETDLFQTEGLTKNGSLSRGITFGSNQDLAVNSNLNLQVAGKLSDNVNILLAATDNSIPIQASGNTQQLQDFDKVFIQLYNKTNKLIAGDFETSDQGGYFLRFNKKAQGANYTTIFPVGSQNLENAGRPGGSQLRDTSKVGMMKVTASAAVSRGSFGRNIIEGVEGNQGPYILTGSGGEQYIVVLSGTEKVFIDGVLMVRGQDNDYVIDYNTAQLTFTARTLITKDKRIIVEFQYAANNFARSLFHLMDEYRQGSLDVKFNVYSEADSKNKPLDQQLTGAQVDTLIKAGNRPAYGSGVDSTAWTNSIVMYAKADTVIGGINYPYYVYSIDSTKAHYQLKFSQVPRGNYNLINSAANGVVYKWVPPVGGVPQGSYEPLVLLIAPKSQQMMTLGADYKIDKNTSFSVEEALSNYNQNTYSPLDKSTDVGTAFHMALNNVQTFRDPNDTTRNGQKSWKLVSSLSYEYVQQTFNPIERYRSTEFERDWNLTNSTPIADQNLIGASFTLTQPKFLSIGYKATGFLEGSYYNAVKQDVVSTFTKKKFSLDWTGSLLNSTGVQTTSFLRNHGTVSQKLKLFTIGLIEQQERNLIRDRGADTIASNSAGFFEWTGFVRNSDTSKIKYNLSYKQRSDYAGYGDGFRQSTFAQETMFSIKFLKNRNNMLNLTSSYRTLEIVDTLVSKLKPGQTLLGRIEHSYSAAHGFFTANTYYEVGSGQEVKQDYSYIQVAAGQGVYQWIDFNHDGIPELNEFVVAVYKDEADYIRVYTPTDQMIAVFTNQFSEAINLKPSAIWNSKKGWRKIVSLFSDQTVYRTDRKTSDDNFEEAYNPFHSSATDTSLKSLNTSFRSSLYFNQLNPKFGVDLNYQDVAGKTLLTDGIDSRNSILKEVKVRWNIRREFTLSFTANEGEKFSSSQFFTDQDFDVFFYGVEPKLTYQPNTKFRVSLTVNYTNKANTMVYGGQVSHQQNYGLDARYNVLQKGSFSAKFNFIELSYDDVTDTPVAFEILQGLNPGANVTWGAAYQRSLANNLTISLNYDGRKSEGSAVVNTGGAQVRASF